MTFRARYFLIGFVALIVAAAGLIGWHLFGGRGKVLKPDGGPVVTVMDFEQSFPLDPLPSGWRHRKFWTRSPMTMSFGVKDGVPGMRFETHDSGSMLFRHAISISPPIQCLHGAGTSNCQSAAQSTSARAKVTIILHGCSFGL